MIYHVDSLSVDLCRSMPNTIFVFGDNLIRSGKAGQAVIRHEPNAFGIPTKRYPALSEHSFFHDATCELEHVLSSLRELYKLARHHDVCWPSKGIGTGLAKMPEKSPKIYNEMCEILFKHFGLRNVK